MTTIPNDTIVRIHSDDDTLLSRPTIVYYHRSCLWSTAKPLDTIVRGVLDDIGARPDLKGYEHLVKAIIVAVQDKDITIGEIYYKISDHIGTNWHNVERRMRSSIADAFENTEPCILRRYFPGHEDDRHMTNRQFVYSIARYIRKEYDNA